MPTANEIGFFLGRSNDAAGRRAIGAGYCLGTTNLPLAFGYEQTTGAGYTKGRFFIATRVVTTDTAPTDRFSIEDDGTSLFSGRVTSADATGGIGYSTGAGGTVTQTTSRTTGVTLNKVCGAVTLVSAAGSATYQTFTVTNSAVAATDTVHVVQKSGSDKYIVLVTAVAAGSFDITYATTGGTTTEQPVLTFTVTKAVTA